MTTVWVKRELNATILAVTLLAIGVVAQAQPCPEDCCALCDSGWVVTEGQIGDYFGGSISLDGVRLAVGAKYRNGTSYDWGKVYVFDYDEGTWDSVTELEASVPDQSAYFGSSVAISASLVLVGAIGDDENGTESGAAYVYDEDEDWDETKLTASDGSTSDYFGSAVAIDGTIAVVGAPGVNNGEGAAYVFDGGDNWDQVAILTASDGTAGDGFGVSVAIDGDVIVIGAHDADSDGTVYVFEKPGNGWDEMTETAQLSPSDAVGDDGFGYSVAISGDRISVGAPLHDQGDSRGAVYVFQDSDGWDNQSQAAEFVACDLGGPLFFGFSVAIDGPVVIAGAYSALDDNYGTAHVFRFFSGLESPGWEYMNALYPEDGDDIDLYGRSVAIRNGLAVVGSPMHTETVNAGAIYEYEGFACPGDTEDDGDVDVRDFLYLLATWGSCPEPCPPSCPADFNGDCEVNVSDFLILLAKWGVCACDLPDPPTLAEELEDACLSQTDWTSYVGVMIDPESSQKDKDNYDCWMNHYINDCNKCDCTHSPCPGDDPYKGT